MKNHKNNPKITQKQLDKLLLLRERDNFPVARQIIPLPSRIFLLNCLIAVVCEFYYPTAVSFNPISGGVDSRSGALAAESSAEIAPAMPLTAQRAAFFLASSS